MLTRHVTPEMIAATDEKFIKWDRAAVEGWLGDEGKRQEALDLLKDPTVYSYAFFRNKHNQPMRMYPYQDVILNDDHRFIIFCAANQIGKSITLDLKALHFALNNPGTTTLMISRTLPQSKDLLRQIKQFLRTSKLDFQYDVGDTYNKTEIYFKHVELVENDDGDLEERDLPQSRIVCVPATEAALGYAADLLLIDELAFYDNGVDFYYQIAFPRTYETKGQVIVFSNPNGQQGIFWQLWNDPDFHKYEFNFLDCPVNKLEEYEALKKKLSKDKFDSTVDAKFTDAEGGFLSLEERKRMQVERPNTVPKISKEQFTIFFDFAKTKDRTVRAIGRAMQQGEEQIAYVDQLKEYPSGTAYNDVIRDLVEFVNLVGPENIRVVGWDNTGVGKGIEDFIKRIQEFGIAIEPVEFSLQNKSRIYTLFKFLVEQERVTVPFIHDCDFQLASLRFKRTSRDYLQVHHENEDDRDDYPDAIAGFCSLVIRPDYVPASITVIKAGEESKDKRLVEEVKKYNIV